MAWHGAAWHGVAWNGTTSHCMASDAHWGSQGGGARRALVIPGSDRGGKLSKIAGAGGGNLGLKKPSQHTQG
ncbi:hypothetical protein CLOM_g14761 [Closterium sp. NIES-68]|nr:hypothetical protein CLOM_g14761 [Closterium sp. NIES-68]